MTINYSKIFCAYVKPNLLGVKRVIQIDIWHFIGSFIFNMPLLLLLIPILNTSNGSDYYEYSWNGGIFASILAIGLVKLLFLRIPRLIICIQIKNDPQNIHHITMYFCTKIVTLIFDIMFDLGMFITVMIFASFNQ